MPRPDTFAVRLMTKTASSDLLARILTPTVGRLLGQDPEPAPQPAAKESGGGGGGAGKEKERPAFIDDQGVIKVPKAHELSPQQLDHILHRIHYDKKHHDLAAEIAEMAKAQSAARPYVVG